MSEQKNSYAIIKTGGKQYQVKQDSFIDVELLNKELGSQVEFAEVLFFSDGSSVEIGEPSINGLIVRGEVIAEVAGEKIDTIKYKRGNSYRRFGHRQHYSRVQISFIGKSSKTK